jgi:hypothetical protein
LSLFWTEIILYSEVKENRYSSNSKSLNSRVSKSPNSILKQCLIKTGDTSRNGRRLRVVGGGSYRPNLAVLFDTLPIGARVLVGTDSSEWVGNYGGVIDGVLFLTNARLFSNVGNPIDGIQSVVRIPIINLQYVSY